MLFYLIRKYSSLIQRLHSMKSKPFCINKCENSIYGNWFFSFLARIFYWFFECVLQCLSHLIDFSPNGSKLFSPAVASKSGYLFIYLFNVELTLSPYLKHYSSWSNDFHQNWGNRLKYCSRVFTLNRSIMIYQRFSYTDGISWTLQNKCFCLQTVFMSTWSIIDIFVWKEL